MIGKLTFALLSLHASATAAITWEQILGRERRDCQGALESRETFAFRDIRWGAATAPLDIKRGASATEPTRFDVVVGDKVLVEVADHRASEPPLVTLWWMGKVSTRTLYEFARKVVPARNGSDIFVTKSFDGWSEGEPGPKISARVDGRVQLGRILTTFWAFEAREWHRKLAGQTMSIGLSNETHEGPLNGLSLRAPTGRAAPGKICLNVRPDLLKHPDFRMALHELIDATSVDYLLWPHIAAALNKVTDELQP